MDYTRYADSDSEVSENETSQRRGLTAGEVIAALRELGNSDDNRGDNRGSVMNANSSFHRFASPVISTPSATTTSTTTTTAAVNTPRTTATATTEVFRDAHTVWVKCEKWETMQLYNSGGDTPPPQSTYPSKAFRVGDNPPVYQYGPADYFRRGGGGGLIGGATAAGRNSDAHLSRGAPPAGRYGHTAVLIHTHQSHGSPQEREPVMLVYGGNTESGNSSVLYTFYLSTGKWTARGSNRPPTPNQHGTCPPKLIYHSAFVRPGCMYQDYTDYDRMIMFGGSPQRHVLSNEIWEYSLHSKTWRNIQPIQDIDATPINITGRRSVTAVYSKEFDSFYVFGGYDGANYLSDCFQYSFKTNQWRRIDTKIGHSRQVPALHGHSAVITNDGRKMIVIGAPSPITDTEIRLWEFDIVEEIWSELIPASTEYVPKVRKHGEAVMYSDRYILLIGGIPGKGVQDYDEIALFDLEKKCWLPCSYSANSTRPHSKAWHSVVVDRTIHPPAVYLYGGKMDQQRRSSDLLRMRIPSIHNTDIIHINSTQAISDFSRLYPDESQTFKRLSDITLVSNDECEFYVHRNILAVRCPFFATLFASDSDWSDSDSQHMALDISSSILDTVLHYIYGHSYLSIQSDSSEGKTRILMDIALAANMLCIKELEQLCMQQLEQNINKKNVIEILRFAKDMSESGQSLKNECFKNMKREDLQEMIEYLLDTSMDMSQSSFAIDEITSVNDIEEDSHHSYKGKGKHRLEDSQESIEAFEDSFQCVGSIRDTSHAESSSSYLTTGSDMILTSPQGSKVGTSVNFNESPSDKSDGEENDWEQRSPKRRKTG